MVGPAKLHRAMSGLTESSAMRAGLIVLALVFILAFLVLPLVAVFTEAFAKGFGAYGEAISDPVALAAIEKAVATFVR